jgi:hypothetical protein
MSRTKLVYTYGENLWVRFGRPDFLQPSQRFTDNWTRRTKIIDYCVNVIDVAQQEKRLNLETVGDDARAQRKIQAALFADETKVRVTYQNDEILLLIPISAIKFTTN